MDTQETTSLEEGKVDNNTVTANETAETTGTALPQSKTEIIERLREIAQTDDISSKQELDLLKQLFYKFHKNETQAAYNAHLENGGTPETFLPATDPAEEQFKAVMQTIKQKRAEWQAEQERQKAENLQKKLDIIERIKVIASTPEEANHAYNEMKELQAQWKEIKTVPAEKAAELWKNYQLYVEQFYDLLKLNNEFREYDFKKNLEAKTKLCEAAEKLAEETDVLSAFQQLQTLHQEYKETGPVAKELREEIWTRFKNASTVINKRHQQHFEELKAKEEENLAQKTALCEKMDALLSDELKTFAEWDARTKEVIALQTEWKGIGFAPQKMNAKIFERFRTACDSFFEKKAAFFKDLKEEQNGNLAKKKALCEQAEALMNSTDWKSAGDALIKLQKEWKNVGAVPKKYSETLWKRFIGACDHFFEQKNKATASTRSEESENLSKKQDIIAQLKALAENGAEEAAEQVRELSRRWNEIGHVPFKEKDKIYAEYREWLDKLYKDLNLSSARRRLDKFKSNLKNVAEKEGNALSRERDRLVRAYEGMKNEIQTYENNLGFLTCSSKSGSSLVNEMKKHVEKLKDELNLMREKIQSIEEEMNKE